ncbi:MAG: hypothetical protein WC663_00620 [Patescibacteria group bacterium]|jgi:hypothetical protein
MTNDEFKSHLRDAFRKKYGKNVKIEMTLIQRATYERKYNKVFKIPAAIDFLQPVAIVEIKVFDTSETFLAFMDINGRGCICSEDKGGNQKQSVIANNHRELSSKS